MPTKLTVELSLDWARSLGSMVSGVWFVGASSAGGVISYNTTTLRYIPVLTPAISSDDAAAKVSFRLPRTIRLTALWVMLSTANGPAASCSFGFNADGVSRPEIVTTIGNSAKKAGAYGEIILPIDTMLCLECVGIVGAPQTIQSIGVGWRESNGLVAA